MLLPLIQRGRVAGESFPCGHAPQPGARPVIAGVLERDECAAARQPSFTVHSLRSNNDWPRGTNYEHAYFLPNGS